MSWFGELTDDEQQALQTPPAEDRQSQTNTRRASRPATPGAPTVTQDELRQMLETDIRENRTNWTEAEIQTFVRTALTSMNLRTDQARDLFAASYRDMLTTIRKAQP